jgi:tripartite-type tricarboxylate transporter receptor subunit TctC
MKLPRRKLSYIVAAAAALLSGPLIAQAQTYPTRPVKLIVGFPAGGLTDIVARLVGQWLSERLGQPFIIENRPGAASNIATEAIVRSPADGYALLVCSGTNAINDTLYERLNFNFMRDVAPVATIADSPLVMEVNPSFPATSVPEFIAYANANSGKLSMASAGNGTPPHVAGELFKMMTGINMIHIPYRGGAPAVTDLLGQQVHVFFGPLGESIEYIRAGKLRPLAVTAAARLEVLPEVPTVSDFLPGFQASLWLGICAPKGTLPEVVDKLSRETNAGLVDPKLKARFAELGLTTLPGSPADFRKLIADETEKWAKVIRVANISAE